MKANIILVLAAVGFTATPSLAQHNRTVVVDGPRYQGTRSATHDRDERSLSRQFQVTRTSDGATASRSFERRRTADGVTRERAHNDFQGRHAGTSYQRTRTETGYVAHQARTVDGQPAGARTVERTRAPRRTGRR